MIGFEQATTRSADRSSTVLIDLILRSTPSNRASEAVRDQVTFFMGAGQITVSGLLVWVVSLLAQRPDVLTKLLEELQAVLDGSPPRMRDMADLPYFDRS